MSAENLSWTYWTDNNSGYIIDSYSTIEIPKNRVLSYEII